MPLIEGTPVSSTGIATTTPEASLPAGIQVGERIILFISARSFIQVPAGWSSLLFGSHSTDASVQKLRVIERIADGTEGSSVTLAINDARDSAHAAYRVSGGSVVEVSAQVESSGSGHPDSPSFSPPGGADDYLWFSVGTAYGIRSFTAAPTNYGNFLNPSTGTAGLDDANLGVAARTLNAATEDPDAFTLSGPSNNWIAFTLAVVPSVGADLVQVANETLRI